MRKLRKRLFPLSYNIETTYWGALRALIYVLLFFLVRAAILQANAALIFSPAYHVIVAALLVYILIGLCLIVYEVCKLSDHSHSHSHGHGHRHHHVASEDTLLAYPTENGTITSDSVDEPRRHRSHSHSHSRQPSGIIPPPSATPERLGGQDENSRRNTPSSKGHRDEAVVVFRPATPVQPAPAAPADTEQPQG